MGGEGPEFGGDGERGREQAVGEGYGEGLPEQQQQRQRQIFERRVMAAGLRPVGRYLRYPPQKVPGASWS